MAYTRSELDTMGCEDPECTDPMCGTLVLGSKCHPGAPVFAQYTPGDGVMRLSCAVCGKPVAGVVLGDEIVGGLPPTTPAGPAAEA